ncbi:MAG: aminotransferase class III-fold pyridoxal phosphate-dependent enzyme, partial [Gammaproteobacteria bacterium]
GEAAQTFKPGSHATTFGGNPLACSAALAVLHTLEHERLVERAAALGERMLNGFARTLAGHQQVRAIRGKGLMIGIELDRPCAELVGQALSQGLLINVTAERVVRLLPPLILTDSEADQIIEGVSALIHAFAKAA